MSLSMLPQLSAAPAFLQWPLGTSFCNQLRSTDAELRVLGMGPSAGHWDTIVFKMPRVSAYMALPAWGLTVSPNYLPDQPKLGLGLGLSYASLGPRPSLTPGTVKVAGGVSGTGYPHGPYLTFSTKQGLPDT